MLMLMGLLFAVAPRDARALPAARAAARRAVAARRDRLLRDAAVAGHAALPSFWAGETLFAALRGELDSLHLGALWTTRRGLTVLTRARLRPAALHGWSKAQEARKARFTRLRALERSLRLLPLGWPVARSW
jgi:hypothetical protein